jgi:hypothetical protein
VEKRESLEIHENRGHSSGPRNENNILCEERQPERGVDCSLIIASPHPQHMHHPIRATDTNESSAASAKKRESSNVWSLTFSNGNGAISQSMKRMSARSGSASFDSILGKIHGAIPIAEQMHR